jgi:hypothetical protein
MIFSKNFSRSWKIYIPFRRSKGFADINDDKARANLALRLWSGCLKAAKNISSETLSRPNSVISRQIAFFWIDLWCKIDLIYRSGGEAAPVWKTLIGQKDDIFLEGIPVNSSIRTHIEI